MAIGCIGRPWRHDTEVNDFTDCFAALGYIFISDERKGSRLSWPVASRAFFMNNRRNISGKSDGRFLGAGIIASEEQRQTPGEQYKLMNRLMVKVEIVLHHIKYNRQYTIRCAKDNVSSLPGNG